MIVVCLICATRSGSSSSSCANLTNVRRCWSSPASPSPCSSSLCVRCCCRPACATCRSGGSTRETPFIDDVVIWNSECRSTPLFISLTCWSNGLSVDRNISKTKEDRCCGRRHPSDTRRNMKNNPLNSKNIVIWRLMKAAVAVLSGLFLCLCCLSLSLSLFVGRKRRGKDLVDHICCLSLRSIWRSLKRHRCWSEITNDERKTSPARTSIVYVRVFDRWMQKWAQSSESLLNRRKRKERNSMWEKEKGEFRLWN